MLLELECELFEIRCCDDLDDATEDNYCLQLKNEDDYDDDEEEADIFSPLIFNLDFKY